jgi:cytidyltransferase-like protein
MSQPSRPAVSQGNPDTPGVLSGVEELARVRRQLTGTVAVCHGCFDLFHVGHLRHLATAKRFSDWLLVTVTCDRHVNKGPGRPVFPAAYRAEVVAAVRHVDFVAVSQWPSAVPVLTMVRPDVFVKGSEYRDHAVGASPTFDLERATADRLGTKLAFTDELTFSSTRVLASGRARPIDWTETLDA